MGLSVLVSATDSVPATLPVAPSTVAAVVFGLGVVSFFVATVLVRTRIDGPGALALTVYCLTLCGASSAGFLLTVVELPFVTEGIFELNVLVALVWIGAVPWLIFSLRYTGRGSGLTARWLLAIALFLLAYLLFLPTQSLLDLPPVAVTAVTFATGAIGLLLAALYVLGGWFILQTSYRQGNVSLPVSGAFGAAGVLLALAPLFGFFSFGFGLAGVYLAVGVPVVLAGTLLCLLVVRTELLSSTAVAAGTAARERAFLDLADTAFVLDDQDRIVELNDAAIATFGRQRSDVLGRPLPAVVDASIDELRATTDGGSLSPDPTASEAARSDLDPSIHTRTIALDTTSGTRRFDVRLSTLSDRHGRQLGTVVSLRDVTDRELREQRIAIFNRVLRHNLRNKLSVVRSATELLAEDAADQERLVSKIESATDELLSVGRQAREIEALLDADAGHHQPIPLGSLVDSTVEEARIAYPATTYTTDITDDDRETPVPKVLTYAMEELVENAAKHNDTADPQVEITASVGDDVASISVRDNGPGIPEQERIAIRESAESPLEHASGIGLWSVRWTVTAVGGDVSVSAAEPQGSVVEITVPIETR